MKPKAKNSVRAKTEKTRAELDLDAVRLLNEVWDRRRDRFIRYEHIKSGKEWTPKRFKMIGHIVKSLESVCNRCLSEILALLGGDGDHVTELNAHGIVHERWLQLHRKLRKAKRPVLRLAGCDDFKKGA